MEKRTKMMKTCKNLHSQIWFNDKECPMCKDIEESDNLIVRMKDDLDDKDLIIKELKDKIKQLKKEV
jgi:hypothetical protein